MNLTGKTIVITGASRGLGKVLAQMFAQRGAKLVLAARDEMELAAVADEVGGLAVVADVTKESDMGRVTAEALGKFGAIDIWVNNAGVWLPRGPVEDIDMKRAHDMIEVNLFGVVYGAKAALAHMKPRGAGTIVNVLSTASILARPLSTMYAASKHAAKGFNDSLREEVKESGIQVIGIYPGGIKTHLFDEKKPADYDEFMEPQFVAEAIIKNLEQQNPEPEIILKRAGQMGDSKQEIANSK